MDRRSRRSALAVQTQSDVNVRQREQTQEGEQSASKKRKIEEKKAARVDDAKPVGKPWWKSSSNDKYYRSFTLRGVTYEEGDCVLVRTDTYDTADIIYIWVNAENEVMLEIRWFYTRGEIQSKVQDHLPTTPDALSHTELLESDHVYDISGECVEKAIQVLSRAEYEETRRVQQQAKPEHYYSDGEEDSDEPSVYWSQLHFNHKQQTVAERFSFDKAQRLKRARGFSRRGKIGKDGSGGIIQGIATSPSTSSEGAERPLGPAGEGLWPKGATSKALDLLHLATVPRSLPCREEEQKEIEAFLRDAITQGNSTAVYVSGFPGTGKTASVRGVIESLQIEQAQHGSSLPHFQYCEVNAMRLRTPKVAYTELWEALTGEERTEQQALKALEGRFSRSSKGHERVVLMIDELDFLYTRNQQVLYNLFEWPMRCNSKLIVIGISNTLDLPDRLMPRISSRMGFKRLVFRPYTNEQIEKIVTSRLEGLVVCEKEAITLLSKKISGVSGDIRRGLQLCRKAIEVCDERLRKAKENNEAPELHKKKVTMEDVQLASKTFMVMPMHAALLAASPIAQLLVASLTFILHSQGREQAPMQEVITRMGLVAHNMKYTEDSCYAMPSRHELMEMIGKMGHTRLILVKQNPGQRTPMLSLNMNPTDVASALRNNEMARFCLPRVLMREFIQT